MAGLSKRAISLRAGVSRATIRDWLRDPASTLARRSRIRSGELDCNASCEPWARLDERAYAHLFGMYLGDGCIARHPHAYRLRIACADSYPRIMDEVEDAIRRVAPNRIGPSPVHRLDSFIGPKR